MREETINWIKNNLHYNPDDGTITNVKTGNNVGHTNRYGYTIINFRLNKKKYNVSAHRCAWILFFGEDTKKDLDHISGDKSDNRICNLREATRSQNEMNNAKINSPCSSQFKGVSFFKRDNKWNSSITLNGRKFYLGRFKSEIDAARAYDVKAIELFGEYARLNFPE
jgi:hypothetical protein